MTRFTPGVVSFYRGRADRSSAIQFKVFPPMHDATGNLQQGCVMIDMTDGPGAFKYDWKNKLSFKLSFTELSSIANYRGKPLKFKHDPNAKREGAGTITKTLEIKPGNQGGGVFIDLVTFKGGTKDKAHAISLNDDEVFAICELCRCAISITIGWDAQYLPQTASPRPQEPAVSHPATPPSGRPVSSPASAVRPPSAPSARPTPPAQPTPPMAPRPTAPRPPLTPPPTSRPPL